MWGVQQVQPLCSRRWLVRLLLQFYTVGMFHKAAFFCESRVLIKRYNQVSVLMPPLFSH